MEPCCTIKYLVPVKVISSSESKCRTCSVIDNVSWTLACLLLKEVDTNLVAATHDMVYAYAVLTE